MGGKTKSAGLPQTLLLKCGAFGNIFSCTFLFKPLFGVWNLNSKFNAGSLGLKLMAMIFVYNLLQTVQCPLAVDLARRHPSIPHQRDQPI